MPFTIDDFLGVFRSYNEAVWPAQVFLIGLALVAVLAVVRARGATRVPALVLAALWFWTGVVYHLAFFRSINRAAILFAALFIVQAGLFTWLAFRRPAIHFAVGRDAPGVLGGLMIAFAFVIYPSLGWLAGHRYPAMPTFGLPCPTTLFTFGLLLWARPGLPRRVLVIPVLWSLVATSAALQLGMVEDLSLPVMAAIATVVSLRGGRSAVRLHPA